jgi:hypothetical protein
LACGPEQKRPRTSRANRKAGQRSHPAKAAGAEGCRGAAAGDACRVFRQAVPMVMMIDPVSSRGQPVM